MRIKALQLASAGPGAPSSAARRSLSLAGRLELSGGGAGGLPSPVSGARS
jgi:hypothetical protein